MRKLEKELKELHMKAGYLCETNDETQGQNAIMHNTKE